MFREKVIFFNALITVFSHMIPSSNNWFEYEIISFLLFIDICLDVLIFDVLDFT